jgi:class 3 adenylate cyclase/tetratricopeptide (TPR) repeat protein
VAELVRDRYELLEVLRRLDATEVVRAVDRQHDRVVALKIRDLAADESGDAYLAEGRALLGLRSHPALPTVRDDFFLDGRHVVVMDWVDGTPVGGYVRADGDPGLPVSTVLNWAGAVAAALDHLHQHDPCVVHGDVRPENVVVTADGAPVLVYGIADLGAGAAEPEYRAPELAGGAPPTSAADVFGLAMTVVFMLTGRPAGPEAVIEWDGVAPELAKRLDRVLRRALDRDPSRRPRRASELVERLAAARDTTVPTGVVTFVLTDIEGSTDLWEAHPDVMAGVVVRHHELAAEVTEAHGGRLPRSQGEGDSTLSAFARATDAVEASLAFQRALAAEPWPDGIELRVRAGVHTGEAQVDRGDYLGAAVSRAARIRALAAGGQVLLSQAVAELVADRLPEGAELLDLGEVKLRGLDRPERVHQLRAPGLRDVAAPLAGDKPVTVRPRFPIALPPDAAPFIGRAEPFEVLGGAWSRTLEAPRRQVVLVGGEPGMGKTRLVAEFAHRAYENGATVLFGRCYEENVVPYRPFVEAIDTYVREGNPVEVRADIVASGSLLARLVPNIAVRFPDLPEPLRAEPDTERYLMFEAAGTLLTGIATRTPLVFVIEDLHWADRPTLALLAHLARDTAAAPLLVLGTYRTGEDGALVATRADLHHDAATVDVVLGGLSESEVGDLIGATTDLERRPDFVTSVRRETDGNPLFVQEICSHVGETGAPAGAFTLEGLGVPEGVKQVIGRRIDRLPDEAGRVLTMAAVIGRDFDLDVLEAVAGDDPDALLTYLEEASAARLVEEVADTVGRYSFVHALINESLYDSLGATRRARLHRRVAEAIEAHRGDALEEHFGELAYHYAAAGRETAKAVEYAGLAGEQALARLAHEEATAQFERGLALLATQDRARCDLLLGLGEARRRAGDVMGSKNAFADAGAVARTLGDAERLARAAVGNFRGHVLANPAWHEGVIELLDDALAALPDDDSPLRSRVLAAMALELYFTPRQEVGAEVSAEAIAMARKLADDDALGFALVCAHTALSDPGHLDDRLRLSTELVEVGERVGNAEFALIGHVHRACDLLEVARVDEARREAEACAYLVDLLGQPINRYFVSWLQSTLALLEGRFDDAEQLAREALEIGVAAEHPDAHVVFATQAVVLGLQRGDLSHLVPIAEQLRDEFSELTSWPAAVTLVMTLGGREAEARELLHECTADIDAIAFSATWFGAMVALTEVARMLDEPTCAPLIYERLAPFADRIAVVSLNLSEVGPIHRPLGVLAGLMADYPRAEAHFEAALATAAAIGAPPHTARTQVDYARMLLQRGGDGDAAQAAARLEAAGPTARALGMEGLVRDIEALRTP